MTHQTVACFVTIECLLASDVVTRGSEFGTKFLTFVTQTFVIGQQQNGCLFWQTFEIFLYRELAVNRFRDSPHNARWIRHFVSGDCFGHAWHRTVKQ
ncbi:Uncharacterised protein [Vibrio cholerae]|nr:Uncharacterised protein [Vibrio cholerae]CSI48219.1 Uncharacterised protein [Vibrio cholerae]CSI74096.1 Uncharacterised protein [Vibrio cholerae]